MGSISTFHLAVAGAGILFSSSTSSCKSSLGTPNRVQSKVLSPMEPALYHVESYILPPSALLLLFGLIKRSIATISQRTQSSIITRHRPFSTLESVRTCGQ
jgi:hypothetical protein